MIVFVAVGCSKKEEAATTAGGKTYSAEKPSEVMGLIKSGIATTGQKVGGSGASSTLSAKVGDVSPFLSSSDCSTHGDPAGNISYSDATYPGKLAYCKLSIDDSSSDTIQGGFTMVKGVACAVEAAGAVYDGVSRTLTVPFTTACFTQAMLNDMGNISSLEMTVKATSPAEFNTNYARGLSIVNAANNIDFKLAANVSATSLEFLALDASSANETGVTTGSLNQSTGVIRFEARTERINCTTSGRCGWNRHIRLYADLTVATDGTLGDIESLSFAYSNISAPPGQTGYSGVLVTASGDNSTGFKPRLWQATNGSSGSPAAASDYVPVANWVEVANTKCYLSGSDSATSCGAGLAKFSASSAFVLSTATHATPSSYATSLAGLTFTSVNLDSDVP